MRSRSFPRVVRSLASLRPPHPLRFARASALALLALSSAAAATAAPVINEIMYRPGATYPENTGLEFIEIHNPDTTAVDLSGWAITTGADFTFPAGTVVAAGGFVVVSSNPTTLQSSGGFASALGPWKSGAKLSNNGEKITLAKADGTVVDVVNYADEGDWAVRTRDSLGGWSWVTPTNTAGKSFERRNPKLAVDSGQNWGASFAAGGSPGAANSLLVANVAPVVTQVKHAPAVPKSTEPVTISCRLSDESPSTALAATLYWRNATSSNPAAFQNAPMTGDGTGYFSATLAALADKQIVEFYIGATDGTLLRTWPAPSSEGQNTNGAYQVDNEVVAGTAPVYRLILTGAENAAFAAYTASGRPGDRLFNFALVASRGTDTTIRYLSSMRVRGNSSRNYSIKPLRISLPTDNRWDGVSDFLINSRGAPIQYLAHRIQRVAGLVAADTSPLEVRRNGIEYSVTTGAVADHGQLVRVEELNGDYLDNHFPAAVDAQLYRKVSISQWANAPASAPANPETTWSGWDKQNNSAGNDWSDVMNFSKVWIETAAPHFTGATSTSVANGTWNGVPFSDAEVAKLSDVADLDYLARWLALMTIMPNAEENLSTGEDDDYAAAFINDGARIRMVPLPHDMDTTFGLGEIAVTATAKGLFDATEIGAPTGMFQDTLMKPLLPLLGDTTRPGNAAFRAKYLTAVRELFGSVFDADTSTNANPPFHQFVDNHLGAWTPASYRTSIKNFITARQTHLLNLVGAAKIPPSAGTSSATFAASSTPTLRLNEILASNVATLLNGATRPDIIELFNSGATAIDLAGKSLTDDPAAKTKYVFPAGTSIAAGGYLLVYADSDTSAPGLHTGFGLDAEGDAVYLYDTTAGGGALIDSLVFGFQLADRSLARTAAVPGTWALATPTFGAANGNGVALGDVNGVKINEWAGSTKIRADEDFMELYNPAVAPVALGGASITDSLQLPARYAFKPLSFIAAGGFLVLDSDRLDFSLNGDFDTLFLSGENGAVIDRVDFNAQQEDHSTGRTTDGSTAWSDFAVPTPGLSNTTVLSANAAALLESLRITEVHYKPVAASGAGDYEFVELKNIGAAALDVGGVRFTNGIDYTFASGTTLAAGAYIVVAKSRTAFLARYPTAAAVLASGNFTGALDNSGENLALTLPAPWAVNILRFRYESTWYALTANNGHSLVVPSPSTSLARNWDDPVTWRASSAANGNPGGDGSGTVPAITSATLANAVYGAAFTHQITASETIVGFAAVNLPAGLAVNASTGLITGAPTATGTFTVALSATNAGGTSASAILTLNVAKATATVALGNLSVAYTGAPQPATATTTPAGLSTTFTYAGGAIVPVNSGTYALVATVSHSNYTGTASGTYTIAASPLPQIATQPVGATVTTGGNATFTVVAAGQATLQYQWLRNGVALNGATGASLALGNVQLSDAGAYAVVVSNSLGTIASQPALLGISSTAKVAGTASEIASNIQHANGNVYDQSLLNGAAASFTADAGQVHRVSFVDLTNDIVQVEFSGAGTVTIQLENATGPAVAASYNQPSIDYMKGHASIVVAGANETTHLSVFSVGRATAVNQSLFRDDVVYDGVADLGSISIASASGKFGGLRTANASYFNTRGLTGVHAPGVQFTGPVFVGDVSAFGEATPVLLFGSVTDIRITGGDLLQDNTRAVQVSGIATLQFTAGANSHGVAMPAQPNRARLEQNGLDVTSQLVP